VLCRSRYRRRARLISPAGFELYGYRDVGRLGAVDYRAYAGTIFLDAGTQPPGSAFGLVRLTIPYLVGGRVLWEPAVEGLRVGASIQQLRLETDLLDLRDPQMPIPVSADISATLAMASLEYAVDDILFAAEYARWYTSVERRSMLSTGSRRRACAPGLVAYPGLARARRRVLLHTLRDGRHGRGGNTTPPGGEDRPRRRQTSARFTTLALPSYRRA
jgi:hypothetical protein